MDILELMRDDHLDSLTTVRELLTIAERVDARDRVAVLLERLGEGLALHMQSEQAAFGKGAQRRGPDFDELVQRSTRDHQMISRLVRLCGSAPPCADLRLYRALSTLEDVLSGHISRVQYQLFQVLYDQLDREERHDLGHLMMAEQVRLLGSRGEPRAQDVQQQQAA